MIVVSDTSPVSNLFMIDELDLLRKVYNEIFLPKAVMEELLVLENFGLNIHSIKQANWIKSIEVTERITVNKLLSDLDLGEAEAIVLAKTLNADWILIDETKGRTIAKSSGLQTIGLLGVFLFAKEQGIIKEVKPYVEQLITKAKFRISQDLFDRILFFADEAKTT
jgi:uncharacterized protein